MSIDIPAHEQSWYKTINLNNIPYNDKTPHKNLLDTLHLDNHIKEVI